MANAERIRNVIALMERAEEAREVQEEGSGWPGWDQESWWTLDEFPRDVRDNTPICKTSFCLAGWAVWVENNMDTDRLRPWAGNLDYFPHEAQKYLELDDEQRERMFSGIPYFNDPVTGNQIFVTTLDDLKMCITQVTGVTFDNKENSNDDRESGLHISASLAGGEGEQPTAQPEGEL